MEKILIAGGFGFIGKNLYEYLSKNYEVIILDKNIDNVFLSKYREIKYYQYDFDKDMNLEEILRKEKPNYIINLISIVTAERNMKIFNEMIRANLDILLSFYEVSKDLEFLKLFIQFGSGEEYGNIDSPFAENDREEPNSPYSLVKQLTTNTAIMLNKNYKFPVCVVRPGNLFGKYQGENKFIPYIINQLLNDFPIDTTFGEQKRDFIYAERFSEGIELIIQNYDEAIGEILNLSSGESLALREIIMFLKEKLCSKSIVNFGVIPYRENEIMDFRLDISKFKKITGNSRNINILEDIKKYIKEFERG